MAWDDELIKAKKTNFEPSSAVEPVKPVVPTRVDDPKSDGNILSQATPVTSQDRPLATSQKAPKVGFDVVVQEDDALRQGDRDARPDGRISAVQRKLNALGLEVGDVDGVIGRRTSKGIQEAQRKLGLPRTGVLDRKTELGLITLSPSQLESFKNISDSDALYQNLGENVPVTSAEAEATTFTSETEGMEEAAERRDAITQLQNDNQDQDQAAAFREPQVSTSPSTSRLRSFDPVEEKELPFSLGILDTEDAQAVTRESQERLKDAGYYRARVDGAGGRSTSNAIKTFQYDVGLEPTGELDEETRFKLAETDLESRPEISNSGDELLEFIGKGESGGYGAANNYNSRTGRTDWGVMDSYFSERYQKPLDKLTIREIQDIQAGGYGTREVFAVGAFQIVPNTLNLAVEALGLTGDEVFDAELQNRIAIEYLAGSKRPKLRDYIRGEEDVIRNEALMQFAQEWASVPIPYAITRKGMLIQRGESYWKPEGNTANAHTAEEAEQLLDSLRAEAIARRSD